MRLYSFGTHLSHRIALTQASNHSDSLGKRNNLTFFFLLYRLVHWTQQPDGIFALQNGDQGYAHVNIIRK